MASGAEVLLSNVSTTPADYEDEFVFDDYIQRCIVGSILSLVCIVGTLGNGLVIAAVVLSRKLRTATNVFVVNLAVADLLVCFTLPWNAVGLFTRPERGWPLPEQLCVAVALISFTCVGCSIYTLATIAVNRWMLITRPSRTYRTCYSPVTLSIMVAIVWVIPFLVAFLPPTFGVGELGYATKYSTCTHKTSHPYSTYYSILQSMIFFPVPLIIIVVSYIKVFQHVKRHTKTMQDRAEQSIESLGSIHDGVTGNSVAYNSRGSDLPTSPARQSRESVAKRRLSKRQIEITKNLFYVVCAFIICITPYAIALLIPPSDPVIPWAAALLLVNSCINPIIYATKHPYFKAIFKLMLTCRCGEIPEQSEFLRSVRSTLRGRKQ